MKYSLSPVKKCHIELKIRRIKVRLLNQLISILVRKRNHTSHNPFKNPEKETKIFHTHDADSESDYTYSIGAQSKPISNPKNSTGIFIKTITYVGMWSGSKGAKHNKKGTKSSSNLERKTHKRK